MTSSRIAWLGTARGRVPSRCASIRCEGGRHSPPGKFLFERLWMSQFEGRGGATLVSASASTVGADVSIDLEHTQCCLICWLGILLLLASRAACGVVWCRELVSSTFRWPSHTAFFFTLLAACVCCMFTHRHIARRAPNADFWPCTASPRTRTPSRTSCSMRRPSRGSSGRYMHTMLVAFRVFSSSSLRSICSCRRSERSTRTRGRWLATHRTSSPRACLSACLPVSDLSVCLFPLLRNAPAAWYTPSVLVLQ